MGGGKVEQVGGWEKREITNVLLILATLNLKLYLRSLAEDGSEDDSPLKVPGQMSSL